MWSESPNLGVCVVLFLLSICSAVPIEPSVVGKRSGMPNMNGSAVIFGAGTYPRANMLSDGSIIGAYTAFSGGYNIIRTIRSTDGGTT